MKATLSVTVITFNEERDIEVCLRSVAWADEIVVVDSLSADQTRQIAERCGARVIERPFPGMSDQRNFAAQQARSDWVLQIDADERVPSELAEEIRRVIGDPGAADLYHVARRNLWLGRWIRHGGWYPDYAPRLYRRGRGHWEGDSHEAFVGTGTSAMLRNDLIHDNLHSVQEHLARQLISANWEIRDAARKNVRFCWFVPADTLASIARRVVKGPWNAVMLRSIYRDFLKNRVEIIWLIPFLPGLRFLYMYVIRLGFLDGVAGFWVAALSAVFTTMRYAKLWEYAVNRRGGGAGGVPTDADMQAMHRRWWPNE